MTRLTSWEPRTRRRVAGVRGLHESLSSPATNHFLETHGVLAYGRDTRRMAGIPLDNSRSSDGRVLERGEEYHYKPRCGLKGDKYIPNGWQKEDLGELAESGMLRRDQGKAMAIAFRGYSGRTGFRMN